MSGDGYCHSEFVFGKGEAKVTLCCQLKTHPAKIDHYRRRTVVSESGRVLTLSLRWNGVTGRLRIERQAKGAGLEKFRLVEEQP